MNNFPMFALLRPKHWVKNFLIFLPMLLADKFHDKQLVICALLGFASFSFMSSSCYILNDIRDVDHDRLHPDKAKRPLAAAIVSVRSALVVAFFMIAGSIAISSYLGKSALIHLLVYFAINYLYSTFLKGVRFIDVIILSVFYLIRIFYGSVITNVPLTGWFIATSTLLFLTLATHKRYMECYLSVRDKISGRNYMKEDVLFLKVFSLMLAVGTLVMLNMHAYFVLNIQEPVIIAVVNLMSTAIMFLYFDTSKNKSEDPVDRILKNPLLLIMISVFIALYIWEVIVIL